MINGAIIQQKIPKLDNLPAIPTSIILTELGSGNNTPLVRIEWVDSITEDVTNSKVYRDDILLGIVNIGVQTFDDDTALNSSSYKYEVQALNSVGESTQEVEGENVESITVSSKPNIPTGLQLSEYEVVSELEIPTGITLREVMNIPTGIKLRETLATNLTDYDLTTTYDEQTNYSE